MSEQQKHYLNLLYNYHFIWRPPAQMPSERYNDELEKTLFKFAKISALCWLNNKTVREIRETTLGVPKCSQILVKVGSHANHMNRKMSPKISTTWFVGVKLQGCIDEIISFPEG